MKLKLTALALVAVLLSLVFMAPTMDAQAAKSTGSITTAVTGAGTYNGLPVTFTGTATITKFIAQNGQLMAVGTVTGAASTADGTVVNTVSGVPFTAPVSKNASSSTTAASTMIPMATCSILSLHIGAIHLDLLGLVVDLNPIDLNITAQSGSGNLLGNLLCAVAGLLDNNGPLTAITNLLNQILGLLGNITL